MDFHELIEKNVALVECGGEKGTAFLISNNQALTVRHCVEKYFEDGHNPIELHFINIQNTEVFRTAIPNRLTNDADQIIILDLNEGVCIDHPTLAFGTIPMFKQVKIFGYSCAEAAWDRFEISRSYNDNHVKINDATMILRPIITKQKDFKGLSGSPVIFDEKIVAVVQEQTTQASDAICIQCYEFNPFISVFESKGIYLEKLTPHYELDKEVFFYSRKNSINGTNCITCGHIYDYQETIIELHDEKLSEISALHRSGGEVEAWDRLSKSIREIAADPNVDSRIVAKYYYKMALWFLDDKDDISNAQKYYKKAINCDNTIDTRIYQATKALKEGNIQSPEELLLPIDNIFILNTYLRIKIDKRETATVREIYERYEKEIAYNHVTWYMMSLACVYEQDYESADDYLARAIEADSSVPYYYLMQGVCQYWRCIPEDLRISKELFPVLYEQRMLYLKTSEKEFIKKATTCYKKAYDMAKYVNNHSLQITILGVWLNTLSIDDSYNKEARSIVNELRELDSYNILALNYCIRNGNLIENISYKELEQKIASADLKIGYAMTIISYAIEKGDFKSAKEYLNRYKNIFTKQNAVDYWFIYYLRICNTDDELMEFKKMISESSKKDVDYERFYGCILEKEKRYEELKNHSEAIYLKYETRLDLMNLVYSCRLAKDWKLTEKYATILLNDYNDSIANEDIVKAKIELGQYPEAMELIEDIQASGLYDDMSRIEFYKLDMLVRIPDYSAASSLAYSLWKKHKSEELAMRCSDIYVRNGEVSTAISVLREAEYAGVQSRMLYQKLAYCLLGEDNKECWKYVKKAVEFENELPEILLWASHIGYQIGKGDQAFQYMQSYHIKYPNSSALRIADIDEVQDWIAETREKQRDWLERILSGEIANHFFLDSNKNLCFAEYYYNLWEVNNLFSINYAGHHLCNEDLKMVEDRVIMDFSACLMAQQLDLFSELQKMFNEIWIPGELLNLILEEKKRLMITQPDLIEKRGKLMEYCKNRLTLNYIKCDSYVESEEFEGIEATDVINFETANSHSAVWVADHFFTEILQRGSKMPKRLADQTVCTEDVVEALFREKLISEDSHSSFVASKNSSKEEKVNKLIKEHPPLFVDLLFLEQLNDINALVALSGKYQLLVTEDIFTPITNSLSQLKINNEYIKRLENLENILYDLKEEKVLKFCPLAERQYESGHYSDMLLDIVTFSLNRHMAIWIDDRFMTSYQRMGSNVIINSIDVLEVMYDRKIITLEFYIEKMSLLLRKNVKFIVPPVKYVFYFLERAVVSKKNYLEESDDLEHVRNYILEICDDGSNIRQKGLNHDQIPEKVWFMFYLQSDSIKLLNYIWRSPKDNKWKYAVSDWVIHYYSDLAYTDWNMGSAKQQKRIIAVRLTDFIIKGIVVFTVEDQRKEYFRWMFRWLSSYFEKNKELKQTVLSFTEEIMIDYLRDANQKMTEEEIFVVKKQFSDGIYALPKEFREIILQNKILSNNFNLFYEKVVNLSSKVSIPIHIFDKWIFEIMEKPEDERLTFEYQGKSYCLWWVSKFPLYEDVHIAFGKSYKKEKIFQYFAYRLNHSHKIVRQAAYNLIEGYLTEEDKAMLPSLKSRRYQESSVKLSIAAQWNASYVESILRQSLKECLIGTHGVFFPSSPNYFKQIIENSSMFEGYSGALPVLSKECNDNIEMPIISNNPIRRLNSIAQMFRIKKPLDEIKAEVLNMLHVYEDEEFCCYEVYLLSLKMAWKNINTIESYEQETMEDKILWSYIWADILINNLTTLISDKEVEFSFEQFKVFLEQEMDFNKSDEFFNIMDGDILSPNDMNLMRICFTGSISLWNIYQGNKTKDEEFIMACFSEVINWMSLDAIYWKETETSHKSLTNHFASYLDGNLWDKFAFMSGQGEAFSNAYNEHICERLNSLLERDALQKGDWAYIYTISREQMEPDIADIIVKIIEKHMLYNDQFVFEPKVCRIVTYVVWQIPSYYTAFMDMMSKKLKEFMLNHTKAWYKCLGILYDVGVLAGKEADVYNYILGFLEDICLIDLCIEDRRFLEFFDSMLFSMPMEYAGRINKIKLSFMKTNVKQEIVKI